MPLVTIHRLFGCLVGALVGRLQEAHKFSVCLSCCSYQYGGAHLKHGVPQHPTCAIHTGTPDAGKQAPTLPRIHRVFTCIRVACYTDYNSSTALTLAWLTGCFRRVVAESRFWRTARGRECWVLCGRTARAVSGWALEHPRSVPRLLGSSSTCCWFCCVVWMRRWRHLLLRKWRVEGCRNGH